MSTTVACMGQLASSVPNQVTITLRPSLDHVKPTREQDGSTRIKFGFSGFLLIWLHQSGWPKVAIREKREVSSPEMSGWNLQFSKQMYVIPDYYPEHV